MTDELDALAARLIDWSKVPSPLDQQKAAYRPLRSIDEMLGLYRERYRRERLMEKNNAG